MSTPLKNPVGFLQEIVQRHKIETLPIYIEAAVSGQDHCKSFTVQCKFLNYEVSATASQKKTAKTEAAKAMVEKLNEEKFFEKLNINVAVGAVANVNAPRSFVSKSSISRLQEYGQFTKTCLPVYKESTVVGSTGFVCECKFGNEKATGHGSTKKGAKEQAAFNMCVRLGLQETSASTRDLALPLPAASPSPSPCPSPSLMMEIENSVSDDDLPASATASGSVTIGEAGPKNFIVELNELCQRNKKPLPVYVEKGVTQGHFVVECTVGDAKALGRGMTKKCAKAEAAARCLKLIRATMPAHTFSRLVMGLQEDEMAALQARVRHLNMRNRRANPLPEWVEPNTNRGGDKEEEEFAAAPRLDDSVVEIEPRSDENLVGNENLIVMGSPELPNDPAYTNGPFYTTDKKSIDAYFDNEKKTLADSDQVVFSAPMPPPTPRPILPVASAPADGVSK